MVLTLDKSIEVLKRDGDPTLEEAKAILIFAASMEKDEHAVGLVMDLVHKISKSQDMGFRTAISGSQEFTDLHDRFMAFLKAERKPERADR